MFYNLRHRLRATPFGAELVRFRGRCNAARLSVLSQRLFRKALDLLPKIRFRVRRPHERLGDLCCRLVQVVQHRLLQRSHRRVGCPRRTHSVRSLRQTIAPPGLNQLPAGGREVDVITRVARQPCAHLVDLVRFRSCPSPDERRKPPGRFASMSLREPQELLWLRGGVDSNC